MVEAKAVAELSELFALSVIGRCIVFFFLDILRANDR
jgi:hypothetical protein